MRPRGVCGPTEWTRFAVRGTRFERAGRRLRARLTPGRSWPVNDDPGQCGDNYDQEGEFPDFEPCHAHLGWRATG